MDPALLAIFDKAVAKIQSQEPATYTLTEKQQALCDMAGHRPAITKRKHATIGTINTVMREAINRRDAFVKDHGDQPASGVFDAPPIMCKCWLTFNCTLTAIFDPSLQAIEHRIHSHFASQCTCCMLTLACTCFLQ